MKTAIACLVLAALSFHVHANEQIQFKTGSTVYICDHVSGGEGCGEVSADLKMRTVTLTAIKDSQYLEGEYTSPILSEYGQLFQTHVTIYKVIKKKGSHYLFYVEMKSAPDGDWSKALVSNHYAFTKGMDNLNALHFSGRTLFKDRTVDQEQVKEEMVPDFFLYPANGEFDEVLPLKH